MNESANPGRPALDGTERGHVGADRVRRRFTGALRDPHDRAGDGRGVAVSSQVEIRAAREEEFADIGALTVGVYVGEGYVHAESPYVAELFDTATRARSAQVLTATRAGEVLGSVTIARPRTSYADIARAGELEFRMLVVDPRARGGGAGAALVGAVVDIARAEDFDAVVLTTMPGMADARRMYDRLGFVHVPERDWATDTGIPLTVMRLAL